MPNIPVPVLNQTMPSTSGMPRAAQQVPVFQAPAGSLNSSQLLGTAVAGIGTAAINAGELEQKRQDLVDKKETADALIAGKLQGLRALPALQTLYDTEMQNPDYSTFSTRFLEKGRALLEEQGSNLAPKALPYYQASVEDNLAVMQREALGVVAKRRDEAGKYVFEATIAEKQQAMIAAKDPLAFAVAQAELAQTTKDMVDAGLAPGGASFERVRKTEEAVATQRTQNANRTMPTEMITHLKLLASDKPGTPGLPVPPPHMVAPLLDDARQELTRAQASTHRGDLQADKDVGKAQEHAEITLSNKLEAIMQTPRPDPVALQAVQREIMAARTPATPNGEGLISPEGGQRLLSLSRAFLTAATSPREAKENERVKFMLKTGVNNPQEGIPYPTVPEIVTAMNRGDINGETATSIMADRAKQLDAAHPSKIPEVVQAKDLMRQGIMASLGEDDLPMDMMGKTGSLSGKLAGGAQRERYFEAVRLYDSSMAWLQSKGVTPHDKIAIAREHAAPLGEKIASNYALYFREKSKETLPKLSDGLEETFATEGITAAVHRLEAMKETMAPAAYVALRNNLARREALKWVGAEPVSTDPVAKAPETGIMDTLTKWAAWYIGMQLPTTPGTKPQ